jgi:heme/copper-type cytochrome/quinol oxidase subunit 2
MFFVDFFVGSLAMQFQLVGELDFYTTLFPQFAMLQQPGSTQMESIIDFHHDLMTFLVFIVFFVTYVLGYTWYKSDWRNPSFFVGSWDHQFTHFASLEIIWTLIPMLILFSIGGPSFALLYSAEDLLKCNLTLKVIGAQWYWIYEYGDAFWGENPISIESRMVDEDMLQFGETRLLAVDNPVLLPAESRIRFLITSIDVIHSWAVPSLAIKLDACPGRLNETFSFILREGHYYGQCSEICGINHGFMPIHVVAVDSGSFSNMVLNSTK